LENLNQTLASAPFHCCTATPPPELQQRQADEEKQSPQSFERVPTPSVDWSNLATPPKVELSVLLSCATYAATTCYETHPGELPTPLWPRRRKRRRKRSLVEQVLASPVSSLPLFGLHRAGAPLPSYDRITVGCPLSPDRPS
jgi:hypothetical protein